jgi:hypothetical protein
VGVESDMKSKSSNKENAERGYNTVRIELCFVRDN